MVTQIIYLYPSEKSNKKWTAQIDNKKVHFGASGYEDYTIHKDEERKNRYVKRHKGKENWGKSGLKTPGFWSRWLLWNKPSFRGSIKDMENRFNIKIKVKRN